MKYVNLRHIRLEVFEKILQYIYSDSIELNGKNVFDLLKWSNYFDVKELESECVKFIDENALGLGAMIKTYYLAKVLDNETLLACILERLISAKDFDKFLAHKMFESVPADMLGDVICNVRDTNEDVKVKVVLRWIKADEEKRTGMLGGLLEKANVKCMSPQLLKEFVGMGRISWW